jgi:hypothetical protein
MRVRLNSYNTKNPIEFTSVNMRLRRISALYLQKITTRISITMCSKKKNVIRHCLFQKQIEIQLLKFLIGMNIDF